MSESGSYYYCTALSGEDVYHICINCDLTISCNCVDSHGTGRIGDFSKQTFAEIWKAPDGVAQEFRNALASGKHANIVCQHCGALRKVDKPTAELKRLQTDYPKGIMVENGIACNYSCICCVRPYLASIRNRHRMNLVDLEKVSLLLKALQMRVVYYFNLSEPFASSTILEEIQLIREYNPTIELVASTNGGLLNNDKARAAALLMDEVIFSIDGGTQEVAQIYQKGISYSEVLENVRNLILARGDRKTPVILWKYVAFPWNDSEEQICKAIETAATLGCDKIEFNIGITGDGSRSNLFEQEFFQKLPFYRYAEYCIIDLKTNTTK